MTDQITLKYLHIIVVSKADISPAKGVAATREIGLEVNADKTKYTVMSRDQNAGRIHSVRIDNSTFDRVEDFKYLGTTLTNQNSIAEKLRAD